MIPPTRTRPATSAAVRPVRTATATPVGPSGGDAGQASQRSPGERHDRRSRRGRATLRPGSRRSRPRRAAGRDGRPGRRSRAMAAATVRGRERVGPPRAQPPADDRSRLDVHPRRSFASDSAADGRGRCGTARRWRWRNGAARGERDGRVRTALRWRWAAGCSWRARSWGQASTAAAGRGRARGSPRAPAPRRRRRPPGRPRSTGVTHIGRSVPVRAAGGGPRGPLVPCRSDERRPRPYPHEDRACLPDRARRRAPRRRAAVVHDTRSPPIRCRRAPTRRGRRRPRSRWFRRRAR